MLRVLRSLTARCAATDGPPVDALSTRRCAMRSSRSDGPPPVVDDTRAEIAKMLTAASFAAQREFPVVGSALVPTPWDRRHAGINTLLDDWELASE
jgi:hypothetical protein